MSSGVDATAAVTVLLPVHNGGQHLRAAVDSILDQTHRNLELLLIDDGSTDGAIDGIAAMQDARVRIMRQENLGLVATLNRGLVEAQHDVIARMDADDVSEPTRLAAQIGFLAAHPMAAAVGCCYTVIDSSDALVGEVHVAASPGYQRRRFYFRNVLPHAGMTFRRDAALAVGGYRDVGPAEDYDLWVRLAAAHDVCALPQQLLRYRRTSTGISLTGRERQREAHKEIRERLHRERPLRVGWRQVMTDGEGHVDAFGQLCVGAARTHAFDHAWLLLLCARRRHLSTAATLAWGLCCFLARRPSGVFGLLDVVRRRSKG